MYFVAVENLKQIRDDLKGKRKAFLKRGCLSSNPGQDTDQWVSLANQVTSLGFGFLSNMGVMALVPILLASCED